MATVVSTSAYERVSEAGGGSDTQQVLSTLQIGNEWIEEETGGLGRVYYNMLRFLPEAGVTARGVVAGTPSIVERSELPVTGFGSAEVGLPRRLLSARRVIRQELEQHRFDLIAIHFALYGLPIIDLLTDRPVVIHFHGPWALESAKERESAWAVRVKRLIERAVYRCGTRFVVLSEAFRDVLHQTYGVPERHISIVPTGVDLESFHVASAKQQARERLGWPTDRPIILCVRRLVQRMGLENLIAAAAQLREREPEALILIAGKGPLRERLQHMIADRDLTEHVRLLGFVPEEDLPYAYRAANFTIVPTLELEGMGCITLESLAAGTPVLVTPIGGLPEAVGALSRDLVLPSSSVEDLAEGMRQALSGGITLPSEERCREYTRQHFDWSVIAGRLREVYQNALP